MDEGTVPSTSVKAEAPKKQPAPQARLRTLGIVTVLFVSTAMGFLGGWLGAENKLSNGELSQNSQQQIVSSESDLISSIAKEVGPSVVSVNVTANVRKKMLRSELRIQSRVEAGEYTDYGLMHQHAVSYDYVYRGKGKKKIRNRLYFGQSNGFTMYAAGQRTGSGGGITSTSAFVSQDYAYDALFLGRNESEGLLSQQFHRSQGGLAAPTNLGANLMLITLNTEFDIPVKFPIGLYGGYALLNNKVISKANETSWTNAWNAGVSLPLIRNIFQIYVPVVYSNNINDEVKMKDLKFGETIMFELNLKLCNPLEIARNFDL